MAAGYSRLNVKEVFTQYGFTKAWGVKWKVFI